MKNKGQFMAVNDSLKTVLNSYGMLFFSTHRYFSGLILLVSFFIPIAGISAFLALSTAIIAANLLGFNREQLITGIYSYSAILFGLGFASNYEIGLAFWTLLIVGSVLTLLISVAIINYLGSKKIPGLSLAFIFTTWIIILSARQFAGIGLTQRHIYWVNETYQIGGESLVKIVTTFENLELPNYVAGFFRSMSAILFQGNIAAGILLSVGLLLFSRISFLLMILGYSIAIGFNHLMGGFNTGSLSYYNMGTNFMLVSAALGGFYLIPSIRSFLWLTFSVPIAYVLVVGLSSIMYTFGLPVFSLPFCITVILFLYALQLRTRQGKLTLTPIQYYHPETNLYRYLNGKERLLNRFYQLFSLPFMGEWMVSQGYDGKMTHKGDWSHAIDFVILDEEMKTFRLPAKQPSDFHCYNKPVLCPADGRVQEIVDYVEDNEIGTNNTRQNWGNTIIIHHATGLYSKISHLKKGSFKVAVGDFVRKGDIIASCGNSGRSPEPHIHFQLQATPYIGSKTLSHPIGYYYASKNGIKTLKSFSVPEEGSFISNVIPNQQLQKAFDFQPGFCMKAKADGFESEEWEVFTDIYNETFFYCKESASYAYFVQDGTVFYFTNYVGNKKSLLYYFYTSAYKVLMASEKNIVIQDQFPITLHNSSIIKYIQDLISPFHIFIQLKFACWNEEDDQLSLNGDLRILSTCKREILGNGNILSQSEILISNQKINRIQIQWNTSQLTIICSTGD